MALRERTVRHEGDSCKATSDARPQDVFANTFRKQNMQGRDVPGFLVIEDGMELMIVVDGRASTENQ